MFFQYANHGSLMRTCFVNISLHTPDWVLCFHKFGRNLPFTAVNGRQSSIDFCYFEHIVNCFATMLKQKTAGLRRGGLHPHHLGPPPPSPPSPHPAPPPLSSRYHDPLEAKIIGRHVHLWNILHYIVFRSSDLILTCLILSSFLLSLSVFFFFFFFFYKLFAQESTIFFFFHSNVLGHRIFVTKTVFKY